MGDGGSSEFTALFLEEGGQHLSNLKKALDSLAGNPADAAASEAARLASHTLKGISAQLGFAEVAKVGGAAEELFIALRDSKKTVTAEMASALKECAGVLDGMLAKIKDGGDAGLAPQELIGRVGSLRDGAKSSGAAK